jgi:hypothetical protein
MHQSVVHLQQNVNMLRSPEPRYGYPAHHCMGDEKAEPLLIITRALAG